MIDAVEFECLTGPAKLFEDKTQVLHGSDYLREVNDRESYIPQEIFAVLITGLLKFLLMDWMNWRAFYITAAILFWTVFIYRSYKNNPDVAERWGIRRKNFKQSMRALLPFGLVASALILIYGYFSDAEFINWHILPILVFYPLWGTFQQFIVAGLVAGNLQYQKMVPLNRFWITIIVSLLFALMHAPHWFLAGYVLIMEIFFLSVFLRLRNIWALGFFHGIVSTLFLYFVSGRDLLEELYAVFI